MDSHGPESRRQLSSAIGIRPVFIEFGGMADVRRPRYYWVDWPLVESEEVTLRDATEYGMVSLESAVPARVRDFFTDGGQRAVEGG
eukprot:4604783-Lingulodinium_polyedra.AAC.1